MKDTFTRYYQENTWGDPESRSGPGSTMAHTRQTRLDIAALIEKYNIKSILDAPCGDYNWFGLINRTIPYVGGDIVEPLIEKNQDLHGDDLTSFIVLDITKDPLPTADLMLCRDCWPHFSDADIRAAIDNFLQSRIPYLLTTNCGNKANQDIVTGGYRNLNLHMPPFSFGLPLEVINEWTWEGFAPKTLNLYHRTALIK